MPPPPRKRGGCIICISIAILAVIGGGVFTVLCLCGYFPGIYDPNAEGSFMQQVTNGGSAKGSGTKVTSSGGEALWSSPWVRGVAVTAVLGVFYYVYQHFATPEPMLQRPDAYVETKETSDKNGNFMTQIVNQFTKQPDVSTLDDDPAGPTSIWEYWKDVSKRSDDPKAFDKLPVKQDPVSTYEDDYFKSNGEEPSFPEDDPNYKPGLWQSLNPWGKTERQRKEAELAAKNAEPSSWFGWGKSKSPEAAEEPKAAPLVTKDSTKDTGLWTQIVNPFLPGVSTPEDDPNGTSENPELAAPAAQEQSTLADHPNASSFLMR